MYRLAVKAQRQFPLRLTKADPCLLPELSGASVPEVQELARASNVARVPTLSKEACSQSPIATDRSYIE